MLSWSRPSLASAFAHRASLGEDDSLFAFGQIDRDRPKEGPDGDGYERFACPGQGEHPHLNCRLRSASAKKALGQIPVLDPPLDPPKVCTKSAVTIAPDIGARHRQDLTFGSPEWARTYATYRNTIEGTNGYVKDAAHEALGQPGRRRVRGIAAQSLFVGLLLMVPTFARSPPTGCSSQQVMGPK